MSRTSFPPDPVAAARWARIAPAATPWLHEEVARRMQQRLQWFVRKPTSWCHWDAVRGGLQTHALIRQQLPDAVCHVHETQPRLAPVARKALAGAWWQRLGPGSPATHFAPPPDAGVGMLWANMCLHASAWPQQLLGDWHRALASDGFLMFSCLGPDTLRELRQLYADCGWGFASHDFTDMHDWGDMLVRQGFADPVVDMEMLQLTYETPQRLLQELRELGRNLHPQRFAGSRGKGWQRQLHTALQQRLSSPAHGGKLALTFEIIYGHAIKPAPGFRVAAQSNISLDDMRSALQKGRGGGA